MLAAPSPVRGQEDDSFSPVADAIAIRPFAFIAAAGGAAGVVLFSPYSFTDGAVRSIVQSDRNQSFLRSTGNFFVEGARGVARSFSDASWCPVEYAVSPPLGQRRACDGIAWSQQGVFAPQVEPPRS